MEGDHAGTLLASSLGHNNTPRATPTNKERTSPHTPITPSLTNTRRQDRFIHRLTTFGGDDDDDEDDEDDGDDDDDDVA